MKFSPERLEADKNVEPENTGLPEVSEPDLLTDLLDLAALAARNWLTLVMAVMAAIAIGLGVHRWTPDRHVASALVTFETGAPLGADVGEDGAADAAFLHTQIAAILSQDILSRVVRSRQFKELNSDVLLYTLADAVRSAAHAIVAGPESLAAETAVDEREIVDQLRRALVVERIGQSRAVEISVRSQDPQSSVTLVSLVLDEYRQARMQAHVKAVRRSGDWLAARLEALDGEIRAAEGAAFARREGAPSTVELVEIRRLEAELEGRRSVYDSLLQEYLRVVGREGLPPPGDLIVLSEPTPPLRPSWPSMTVIVAAAATVGGSVTLFGLIVGRRIAATKRTRI